MTTKAAQTSAPGVKPPVVDSLLKEWVEQSKRQWIDWTTFLLKKLIDSKPPTVPSQARAPESADEFLKTWSDQHGWHKWYPVKEVIRFAKAYNAERVSALTKQRETLEQLGQLTELTDQCRRVICGISAVKHCIAYCDMKRAWDISDQALDLMSERATNAEADLAAAAALINEQGKVVAAVGPMDEFDTYDDQAAKVRSLYSELAAAREEIATLQGIVDRTRDDLKAFRELEIKCAAAQKDIERLTTKLEEKWTASLNPGVAPARSTESEKNDAGRQ